MCEVCETRNIFSGYILPNGGHLDLILDSACSDKPCFDIQLYIDGEFIVDSSVPINYCPSCGEKLILKECNATKTDIITDPIVNQLSALYRSKRKELSDYETRLRDIQFKMEDKKHTTVAEMEKLVEDEKYLSGKIAVLTAFELAFYEAREIIMDNIEKYKYIG